MNHVNESHISGSCCFGSSFQHCGLSLGVCHTLYEPTDAYMHLPAYPWTFMTFFFWVNTFDYCLLIYIHCFGFPFPFSHSNIRLIHIRNKSRWGWRRFGLECCTGRCCRCRWFWELILSFGRYTFEARALVAKLNSIDLVESENEKHLFEGFEQVVYIV